MTTNRWKRLSPRLLLVPTVAIMLVALVPATAHAGTLDQQQTNFAGTASQIYDNTASFLVAQTFTAGQSGSLDEVDAVVQAYGGITAPLTVEIRDVPVAGGPPGTTVLASATVPAASIPAYPATNPSFVPATFTTPATVTAGTQYAIVASLKTNLPDDQYYALRVDGGGGDLYPGGAAYGSMTGLGWEHLYSYTADFAFKTYVAPADTTPPTLSVPLPVTVDATSPAGAVVTYIVSASDNQDPNPTVSCAPTSGSTFPIGTTTVNCIATDAAGNSMPGSFTVTVNGVPQQIADQIAVIQGFGLASGTETSFLAKFQAARSALQAGDTATACGALASAGRSARAQSGKKLTVVQANEIIASAQQIASAFGC